MKINIAKKPLIKVIVREFKRIFSSKDLIMICLIAPFVYAFMFAYLYSHERAFDIKIGIINNDNGRMSRTLVRNIDAAPELKTDVSYISPREAFTGIFKNNLGVFYLIPKHFGADLKKGKSVSVFNASNSSNFLIASNVSKTLALISADFPKKQFTKILVDKGYSYNSALAAYAPLQSSSSYLFNTRMNYSDFLLPCLLLAVLQQILLVAVGTTISSEKRDKTEKELYKTAGCSFANVFFGKAAPYIIIGTALNAFNTFIILPTDAIFTHSVLGVLILSTAFIIAVVFFAILISALFRSPEMAMAVLMFYALPTFLLSGFAWPHQAFPPVLKIVSYLFPSTYAATYIRLFTLGDVPLSYAVMPAAGLIVFSAVCYVLARIVEDKTRKIFKSDETACLI
ncbi:MAG: ABC transporter permease [Endomicrobium sp.]|jgi:ABC-2 type transport system permease protein|nr:ABC transporter permease [Endomicrobium sp.]